jgi:hypothetical protein
MSSAHTQNAARPCVAVVVGSSDASLLGLVILYNMLATIPPEVAAPARKSFRGSTGQASIG